MTQGPITTISELEERGRLLWAGQDELTQTRLANPAIREAALAALKADWDRGVPIFFQKTLEHQLALSAEAYDRAEEQTRNAHLVGEVPAETKQLAELGARHREAQRARAQKPRGKITEDGRTLSQIICDFVLKPDSYDQFTRELWPRFFAELERLQLRPAEAAHITDQRKSAYTFRDYSGKQRKITYIRFANIVSSVRQRKKSR